jgi:hypothetical protein
LGKESKLPELEKKVKGDNYVTPPESTHAVILLANIGPAHYVGMQATINGVNSMNKASDIYNHAVYAPFYSDVAIVRK